MNKLILSAVLALSGLTSQAQGVINGFNAFKPPGSSVNALVLDAHWINPLLPEVGRVEVLTADGLTVLSPIKDGQGNKLIAPGVFSLGLMTIPGSTVGSSASVMLRAWDNSTGTTFATALCRGTVHVTFPSVGSANAPSNFVLDSNFRGMILLVPEPSTIALASLGVLGVFFTVRRAN